jgi:RNA polymerase sigma-70 factor (ECF subfamily)
VELETLTDEDLMERYREGDARAFEVLLNRHSRSVYHFALRSVGRSDRAEDLMQEVFLRIVKGAANYRRRAKFTTWLYTIARNLCVDHLRRQKFRRTVSLDQPQGEDPDGAPLLDRVADDALLEDRRAMDRQFSRNLERALADLNPDQREVFLLREFEDLPFADIATIVGCPLNTVKSRMRYALEALRAALTAAGETPDGG